MLPEKIPSQHGITWYVNISPKRWEIYVLYHALYRGPEIENTTICVPPIPGNAALFETSSWTIKCDHSFVTHKSLWCYLFSSHSAWSKIALHRGCRIDGFHKQTDTIHRFIKWTIRHLRRKINNIPHKVVVTQWYELKPGCINKHLPIKFSHMRVVVWNVSTIIENTYEWGHRCIQV